MSDVIVSGMRPTGRLHLGNYHGALENWVRLQDEYRCYYFIADWHALTTGYEDTAALRQYRRELAIDWLASGLDPDKAVLFIQSQVRQHAELALLFGMITPLGWLERVPTFKEQLRELEGRDINNYGLLGYPVLQAADVSLYKANAVPVGEDQVPHLELTREIVRRFNHLYGAIFPEPEARLTKHHVLPGLDGRKMSKSYGNTILLGEDSGAIKRKVMTMVTDPARVHRTDRGNPEICTVFAYERIYLPGDEVEAIARDCRAGQLGCVDCKRRLIEAMSAYWEPHRQHRLRLEAHPDEVDDILAAGSTKAREVAQETLAEVSQAMGL